MKNNKNPLISVIILNCNGLTYLRKTIPQFLKIDYPNYEFIIVDNGSKDGSLEFIRKFKKIKLIENKENLGYSKGKNIGVKKAKGKFIFLLDNDLLFKNKKFLFSLLNFYKTKRNIGFISFPVYNSNENKTNMHYYYLTYNVKARKLIRLDKIKSKEYYPTVSPSGANMFFQKKIWEKLGGFDEIQPYYLDDHDIGPRSIIFGFKNYFLTDNILEHIGFNKEDTETWSWKFKYYFPGLSFSYIKNCNIFNAIRYTFLSHLFCFLRCVNHTIKKRSLLPFYSFLYSNYFFLKNLGYIIKQRKIIQSKRIIREDIFLKIKPPQFD